MMGFSLTIFVPAAEELRALEASFIGEDGEWIALVEADPAFSIPMTRHVAERFSFGLDHIG
jgi:hypothetical protein